jgi:stress response protein SCP2
MQQPNYPPHKHGEPLIPGTWIPVNEPTVSVGLGWDFTGKETFDLDASITGFDEKYNVLEAIYYGNKKGLKGSVIHFGDNLTGEGEGDDEVIQVNLKSVPENVYYLAVTINSYSKNSLIKAQSAYIRLYTNNYSIGRYTLARTKDCIGLLLGVFQRYEAQNTWYFRCMADPIRGNVVTQSYEDIKTLLGNYTIGKDGGKNYVQHPLPGEPLFDFNKWQKVDNRFTYIGLGWDIQQGSNFDLDASIITFDEKNNLSEIIFHRNLHSINNAIIHYGDNRTGVGEGDDEILSIDFANIPLNIFSLAVIINSFKGNSLVSIMNAFIRLYDQTKFIGVNVLEKCPECTGLLLGIFKKEEKTGFWYFCPVRDIITGIEAPQSVNDVKYHLEQHPLKI